MPKTRKNIKGPNQKYKHMANRKIGALWSKKTNEGKEYFSGVISDLRDELQIVVFKNDDANKHG